MKTLRAFQLCCLPLCGALVASAQVTIAMPSIESLSPIYRFPSSTLALAQTFVAPDTTHTRLDQFELRTARDYAPYQVTDFAAYVVQWNSSSPGLQGAPLWTSAIQSTLSLPVHPAHGVTTFETGGVDLQPGQVYALVLFDPTVDNTGSYTWVGTASDAHYNGGRAYNLSNGVSADLYTATISSIGYDLAFGATFSAPGLIAVPEPAAAVAGFGLALVASLFARRLHQRRRSLGRSIVASPIASLTPAP